MWRWVQAQLAHPLRQGWADFSRARATPNIFKVLRSIEGHNREYYGPPAKSSFGPKAYYVLGVSLQTKGPKCLNGPPGDRDRLNATPALRRPWALWQPCHPRVCDHHHIQLLRPLKEPQIS
ncbi:hypothetical protein TNCV_4184661 [Trichonephila clavipes]|nr:hypothetical protein TNCV_4184661 [Trichonephila clavipes]